MKHPREEPSADVRRSAKLQKIHHELLPILSSSSSSTAACSSQLSMAPHQWERDEEVGLFNVAQTLLHGKVYHTRAQLNRDIAYELNKLFPELTVKFTAQTVKAKLSSFKEKWTSQGNIAPEDRMMYTHDGLRITGDAATFEYLFNIESTNSGAISLNDLESGCYGPVNGGCSPFRKRETCPAVQAALAFMYAGNGHQRSTGKELFIFAVMLNDVPCLLATFNTLSNNYEERRNTLIEVFKLGVPGVPKIPGDRLPEDFM